MDPAKATAAGKVSLKRRASLPRPSPSEMDNKREAGPKPPVGNVSDDDLLEIVVEETLEDVISIEFETISFECKISLHPKPTITWYKDGKIIQPDERIVIIDDGAWQRLQIRRVTIIDQGIYTVKCIHKAMALTEKAHLFIIPQIIKDGVCYHKAEHSGSGVIAHINDVKVLQEESFELEAKFQYNAELFAWYRNDQLIVNDIRTTMINSESTASLAIINARTEDTGVYFVVAKTEKGYFSSFADVQVCEKNEMQLLPIIEKELTKEIEAIAGEEIRLIIKAQTDKNTTIKWLKDNTEIKNEALNSNEFKTVDYGNNYFGLTILNPKMTSAGEYKVNLVNDNMKRVVSTSTSLTINPPIMYPLDVKVICKPDSAVACCGTKVSFECSFDLPNPIYYYVIWYVGKYKVERTNSLFNVVFSGAQFLLYIKKLELNMAGEVICELRRAWPDRQSVMIKRAYANLVIIPLSLVGKVREGQVHEGKLFSGKGPDAVGIRVEENLNVTRALAEIQSEEVKFSDAATEKQGSDFLLMIFLCRLDKNGLYFVHVMHGYNTAAETWLELKEYQEESEKIITVIKWTGSTSDHWYCIELGLPKGTFVEAGTSSQPQFEVEDLPLDRLLVLRIKVVRPIKADTISQVRIVPPPEVVPRMAIRHEPQYIDEFGELYSKTGKVIGSGAFGNVSLVRNKTDGAYHAAKFVKTKVGEKRFHIHREFHIMKNLHHPKLIELIDFYESEYEFIFVMEYLWGGELFDRVVAEEYLKETDVVGYVMQICEGLDYIHKMGIIHLDLKPENIICISPNSTQIKLIDFGCARNVNEDVSREICGTKDYVAPEIIDYEPVSIASDMWSLGVVTYMLLSGLMPFSGDSWTERSANITRASYDYDDNAFNEISNMAKNFVDNLLVRRPSGRLTAENALKHAWITDGPSERSKTKHMAKMRKNMKSYLADYRLRWQRAGNVMIAAHRLRAMAGNEPFSRKGFPEIRH